MGEQPRIGALVLETLTTGMYMNPLDALREFVQNSADSIRDAEADGLLAKRSGLIDIRLDPRKRTVTIRDNGIGVRHLEIRDRLISIGISNKHIDTDAGFRGIGRLAAIAYCDTLHFRTSVSGENTLSSVQWDCLKLRQVVSPNLKQPLELADVVAEHTAISHESCALGEHFFEVVMEGITDAGQAFLDDNDLEKYLGQVAPVEFDAQRFVFAQKIAEHTTRCGLVTPTCTILISNSGSQRQVFKPHKTRYSTARSRGGEFDFEVRDICFYPESPSETSQFWIWYGKTDLLGMIDDERVAGIRIRKNNIALGGPDRVADLFAEVAASNRRFNSYYIGELHVLATGAIPNARRDGFEENVDWIQLKKSLQPFVRERCDEIRRLSDDRNRPTQKVLATARSLVQEARTAVSTGFISQEARDSLLSRLDRERERARSAAATPRSKGDAERIAPVLDELDALYGQLQVESRYAVKGLRPDLDRKQRKLIGEILQLLHDVLTKDQYEVAQAAILAKYQNGSSKQP